MNESPITLATSRQAQRALDVSPDTFWRWIDGVAPALEGEGPTGAKWWHRADIERIATDKGRSCNWTTI